MHIAVVEHVIKAISGKFADEIHRRLVNTTTITNHVRQQANYSFQSSPLGVDKAIVRR